MNPILNPNLPAPTQPFTLRDMSKVTLAIVHHSVTTLRTTMAQIDAMHRARGFIFFGYHFGINLSGKIWEGRPLSSVPAAAEGFNTNSVDICLIGNFQSNDAGYNG